MTVVWLIQGGLWVAWVWTEFRCDPPVSSETQAKGVLEEALITLGFRRAGKEPKHASTFNGSVYVQATNIPLANARHVV